MNFAVMIVALLIVIIIVAILIVKRKSVQLPQTKDKVIETAAPSASSDVKPLEISKSWTERLRDGLSRSRKEVWGKLDSILSGGKLSQDQLDQLEEILYGADIGPSTVTELLSMLNKHSGEELGPQELKRLLFNFLRDRMEPVQAKLDPAIYGQKTSGDGKTKTIMIVGVNGAGKTTTIGKLATKLTRQGNKVVVGACDTFRAAAVDQLEVWCQRADAKMIRAKEGAGPSGVAYEALQTALNSKADYCILDTAGRLHTNENLMDELVKTKKVLQKLDPQAPQEIWLVLDAITGQNAIRQAKEFHNALNLSGLLFTKCDGSSKAGSAVAIVKELGVPIAYIGVGENVEDLDIFKLDEYLNALLAM